MKLLPAKRDREEIPRDFRDVSNVLEPVERELNMGISRARWARTRSDFAAATPRRAAWISPQENRLVCITYTRGGDAARNAWRSIESECRVCAAPDTARRALLYPAPFVAYHLGSISVEPWKNLPVRFGTINFHFAWLPRVHSDSDSARMDLYETKFRNLYPMRLR